MLQCNLRRTTAIDTDARIQKFSSTYILSLFDIDSDYFISSS